MTWTRVVIAAVTCAILAAAVLLIPQTDGTSFRNIGVTPEFWLVCAVFIVMNCSSPVEAGLKAFVFFLISQPLIYLLQVPFFDGGFEIFRYYPRWGFYTLLCLPGGMIAWLVKKGGVSGALILSVASGGLGVFAVLFAETTVRDFPKYLISVLFCAFFAVLLPLVLMKTPRDRAVALVITLAVTAAVFCVFFFGGRFSPSQSAEYELDGGGDYYVSYYSGDFGDVVVEDGKLLVRADRYGSGRVTVSDGGGVEQTFVIEYGKETGIVISKE